jgi:putative oxidoreductase
MSPVRTVARAFLGAIFVVSGARSVANPAAQVARAKRVTDRVAPLLEKADPRIPTDAETLVRINGAAQLIGGLLFTTGHFTRPSAAVLAGTLVPTTFAGHPFWTYADKAERRQHQTQFLKNLGLLGGLMLAALDTEGRPGLAWRAGHAVDHTKHSIERSQASVRRRAHTAKREARLAMRAAAAGRKLPG